MAYPEGTGRSPRLAYDYVRKKACKGDWSAAQEAYKEDYEVRLAKERLKQRIKRIQDFK